MSETTTMNPNNWNAVAMLLALTLVSMCNESKGATLKVGDGAPGLQVSKWIQGKPVTTFEKGKVYIVEFWATWCGPCRVSIPHLNELHNKFKDKGVIVIGQDVWEQDASAVAPFIKKMGDQMTYRVALDTDDGIMAKTWMEAAGQNGIPAAFVVDKAGTVVWIGHPMKLNESLLEPILDGSFDTKKAIAAYEAEQKAEEKRRKLWEEFSRSRQNEDWARAESTLGELEKLMPENERDGLGMTRFGFLLDRKDYKTAYKLAADLSDRHQDDVMMQNRIAWSIATKEGIAERDLNLAERIARRANETSKGSNAEVLDTLARVLFLKGEKEGAIDLQQKAVNFAEGARKRQFQSNLQDYKAGKVPDEAAGGRLRREVSRAIQSKEWDKAETALQALEKLVPNQREELAMMQNGFAWQIAITEGIDERGLDFAEKVARRADLATQSSNAEILDTLARVLFLKGQKETAVDLQAKAVQHATGKRKEQFQQTLTSYKKGETPKPY